MGDARRIGSVALLKGPLYAYRTTTFAWGYYLLLGTLLLWAAGLALIIISLRRNSGSAREPQHSLTLTRTWPRRERSIVAALIGLGIAAWTLGVNYLPWLTFTCPSGIVNNIHYFCVSGSVTGNVVYTVIARVPAQSQSYRQIYSQRLISPSILNVGNDVVFGSLVSFTFIALVGVGAALYALLFRERRTWGYWTYFAFVALVTAIIFARSKTVFDDTKIGMDILAIGVFVTIAGALLIGAALVLLQWRRPTPSERRPSE